MFEAVVSPIQAFFRLEAASGLLLLAAAATAFVVANSPAGDLYRSVLATEMTFGVNGHGGHMSLLHLVNDVLMAVFFFVVGMEIKRELAVGELRTFSRAALPAIAALGGMIVPALIYFAFTRGTPGQAGWGIPMATDIAFCIGCLTLLKKKVPHPLIVFVTALAIFDDIGGILVIAIFYGHGLHPSWLIGAGVITAVLFLANRLYVRNGLVYAVAGIALWWCLHHAGIHPTIAGVVLGVMIPAVPTRDPREVLSELGAHVSSLLGKQMEDEIENAEILMIEERLEDLQPPLNRFVHLLHPYVAFVIMPVFAFANAGVSVGGMRPSDLMGGVALGAGLGLLLGKQLGVFLFTIAAVKLGLSAMPGNASAVKLYGVAVVSGIGFTVALFIAGLAFPGDPALLDQAKIGILTASVLSGVIGCGVLASTRPLEVTSPERRPRSA